MVLDLDDAPSDRLSTGFSGIPGGGGGGSIPDPCKRKEEKREININLNQSIN